MSGAPRSEVRRSGLAVFAVSRVRYCLATIVAISDLRILLTPASEKSESECAGSMMRLSTSASRWPNFDISSLPVDWSALRKGQATEGCIHASGC